MPCIAPARGKTDALLPWSDLIDNDPCGLPIVTWVGGVDVSAQSLCLSHYAMKYGQGAVPRGVVGGIDDYVVFLLHADPPLADVKGHPLTLNGDAQLSAAQAKFGSTSLLLDGAGDWLSSPDSPDWAFGAGDFTLDLWAYFTNVATSNQTLVAQYLSTGSGASWLWRWSTTGMYFYYSPDGTALPNVVFTWTPTANTWYHLALVRSGGSLLFFVNGVQVGATQAISGALFDPNTPLSVGAAASGSFPYFGHLDEIRISKGIARWTANFTPPPGPYT